MEAANDVVVLLPKTRVRTKFSIAGRASLIDEEVVYVSAVEGEEETGLEIVQDTAESNAVTRMMDLPPGTSDLFMDLSDFYMKKYATPLTDTERINATVAAAKHVLGLKTVTTVGMIWTDRSADPPMWLRTMFAEMFFGPRSPFTKLAIEAELLKWFDISNLPRLTHLELVNIDARAELAEWNDAVVSTLGRFPPQRISNLILDRRESLDQKISTFALKHFSPTILRVYLDDAQPGVPRTVLGLVAANMPRLSTFGFYFTGVRVELGGGELDVFETILAKPTLRTVKMKNMIMRSTLTTLFFAACIRNPSILHIAFANCAIFTWDVAAQPGVRPLRAEANLLALVYGTGYPEAVAAAQAADADEASDEVIAAAAETVRVGLLDAEAEPVREARRAAVGRALLELESDFVPPSGFVYGTVVRAMCMFMRAPRNCNVRQTLRFDNNLGLQELEMLAEASAVNNVSLAYNYHIDGITAELVFDGTLRRLHFFWLGLRDLFAVGENARRRKVSSAAALAIKYAVYFLGQAKFDAVMSRASEAEAAGTGGDDFAERFFTEFPETLPQLVRLTIREMNRPRIRLQRSMFHRNPNRAINRDFYNTEMVIVNATTLAELGVISYIRSIAFRDFTTIQFGATHTLAFRELLQAAVTDYTNPNANGGNTEVALQIARTQCFEEVNRAMGERAAQLRHAHAHRDAATTMLAATTLAAMTRTANVPAVRFLRNDGDNAVLHRVLKFLI